MIPMVDLKGQYQALRNELDAAIQEVLESTSYILGPNVQAFEKEAAAYLGVAHAISVSSGTDALHLALRAAGIGPGDQVVVPAFTFIATAEAVCHVGAEPVFADVDSETFNLGPESLEAAIGERTRAIIPVHLFGLPADMEAILEIARRRDLLVIEDCAQSFGATFEGRQTGTFGIAGCFSFFPSKNLGAFGDGGLVTTDSDAMADALLALRNHGSRTRYYHDLIGYNSRLDEVQAAVLRVKLPHLEAFNQGRRRAALRYDERLADATVKRPTGTAAGRHVYHQYTLLSEHRDRIMSRLKEAEIASAIYYPVPLHRQKAFAGHDSHPPLPVSESLSRRCLSLPMFPELDDAQITEIAAIVRAAA